MNRINNKMAILVLLIVSLFTIFSACSTGNNAKGVVKQSSSTDKSTNVGTGDNTAVNANAGETGKEAKYYPSSSLNNKAAYNETFDFWFDFPENWKAFDRSENGDGYYIVPDDSNIDIRVYGMYKTGTDEEYYTGIAGKNGKIKDYDFSDGTEGKKITKEASSRIYYVYPDGDTYICFYINYKDNTEWFMSNTVKLESIAASLRTREEGPKLDSGENKITLEDLKLGEIVIDMSYKKVKEIMKDGLVKEETDKLGAKILFYKDNTEIYLVDDTVYSMNVTSSAYQTPRGLKVGDDENSVRELYGEPDNVNSTTDWGYTIDGYELLSIILKDGKVSEIQIDMPQ